MQHSQTELISKCCNAAQHLPISVVIPFHGRVSDLQVPISALERQSIRDFDVVVVADGCDLDDQVLIGLRSQAISASVLRLPEQMGTFQARAAGAAVSTGTYLWFLDHDDTVAPQYLEHMLDRAYSTDADVVECPFLVVPIQGKPYQWRRFNAETVRFSSEILESYLLGKSYNNLANKLIRRKLWQIAIDQIKMVMPPDSPKLMYCEDMLCTAFLYRHANIYCGTMQAEYCYVKRPNGSMHSRNPAIVRDCLNSLEYVLRILLPLIKPQSTVCSLKAFQSGEVEWLLEDLLGRADHSLTSEGWRLVGRIQKLFD